ncbi:MAG: acyl-ACP thioesterase domain-containing protein [Bdellovibrio sp.]
MTLTTWKEDYFITSLLVNPSGHLGLFGLLNLIQETAWMHAEKLGFGMREMEQEGLYWVLTRQKIKMLSWPPLGERITLKTWLVAPEGAFITREFMVTDARGTEIGSCSTSWLALHRDSRKIIAPLELRDWQNLIEPQRTDVITEKISVAGDFDPLAKFRVRNSDLDINQHVNNTKYAQWILDSIPYELHRTLRLKTYSVNFLAETRLGDKVRVEKQLPHLPGEAVYRGVRLEDNKTLFAARLEWEKKI